jgi:TonB family protein
MEDTVMKKVLMTVVVVLLTIGIGCVKRQPERKAGDRGVLKPSAGVHIPVHRVNPHYPAEAADKKIQGWVLMEFTINTEGVPTDIRVVESDPPGVFDQAATDALEQWRYRPVETPVEGQKVKLKFNITKL